MAVMTAAELIAKLKGAQAQPTYYVMGCFGAYISDKNIKRYTTNNDYNRKNAAAIKKNAMGKFGFDCVCLIKGILWGWNANKSATYGGATYTSNGVPDIGADSMIKACKDVSTDFSKIIPGEAVWLSGHIGVYIGDGLVIECTPKWENKVQITACENIGKVAGYNSRRWTKHGKLPYVDYSAVQVQAPIQNTTPVQDNEKTIWDYLVKLTGNTYGAAGLMGNLYAESGLKPGNLQNSYEKSLGMNEAYNTGYWTAQSIKYRERRLELRSAAYMKSIADIEPSVEHIRHIDIRVRENDVYVFCLLPGKTKEKANPLVLDNWKFYVIPTWYIRLECGSNGTITMAKVQRLVKQTEFKDLKADIDQAIDTIEALRKTKPLG